MTQYPPNEFNQLLYDISDTVGKNLLVDFLQHRGYSVGDLEEDYGHDVTATKGGEVYRFEVEMKTGYPFESSSTFPFDTVSFLGRKKRLHDIGVFWYVIICKETEWAVTCHSTDIYKEDYCTDLTIDSPHRSGADRFYRVPKDLCYFFDINNYDR